MLARQVIPLIIAYAKEGEAVGGRTRFQKMIFVLQNKAKFLRERYNFMAHDYGPYSPELQSDIDDLINTGLLRENRETIDEGKIRYQYVITPAGATTLRGILANGQLDKKFKFNRIVGLAEQVKDEFNQMDLTLLLSNIYTQYPDYAKYSKYKF